MLVEFGHIALILAFVIAILQSVYPLWGVSRHDVSLMALARPLAYLQLACLILAFFALSHAFYYDDFTVRYVANNSNLALPWYYKLSAVWGAHEGSLLLWALILALWGAAVAYFSRALPLDALARVLAVMGMICIGFYAFILFTSNPFERTLPEFPVNGADLNPLLQDIGLIIHPPLLYMGYVGFSVAFAFAIAALLAGRLDSTWARWSRPWTLAAWIFLTLGIALGSWWAYYELGWGGWWFWDPVENASFMPWLVGTALLHSLAVSEKRGVFKAWTVLLAISAFSLSLLGTFLVRSGVLVSVHAFASDPERGLFILLFLLLVVGGSLLLFALRASNVKSRGQFALFSRESLLLFNNIMLAAALVVVLLGTLLPLFYKELGFGGISIGASFFNRMFSVLIVPFALALGVGPLVRWKRQGHQVLLLPLSIIALIALVVPAAFLLVFAPLWYWQVYMGLVLACWMMLCTFFDIALRSGVLRQGLNGLKALPSSYWAMIFGHIGFAVLVVGVTVTSFYSEERDVRLAINEQYQIADYTFTFKGVSDVTGANYESKLGHIEVHKGRNLVSSLYPEKRFYPVQGSIMTEAAIDGGLWRDVYAALGERLNDETWALRLYYKPFVRWLWLGALIMALGGVLALCDKRYRRAKVVKPVQTANEELTSKGAGNEKAKPI